VNVESRLKVEIYYCGHTVVSRLTGPVCHFQYTDVTTDDSQQIPDDIDKLVSLIICVAVTVMCAVAYSTATQTNISKHAV